MIKSSAILVLPQIVLLDVYVVLVELVLIETIQIQKNLYSALLVLVPTAVEHQLKI